MSSWTEQLDDALILVASRGRYSALLFFLICLPAAIPSAFLAFSQVFVSATPDHWCQPSPELETLNLTLEQIKHLTIPFMIRKDGSKQYSNCYMYNVNYSQILRQEDTLYYTVPNDEAGEGGGISNSSEIFKRLSKYTDDAASVSLETIKCAYGWEYDTETYVRTLVTDFNVVCDDGWWPQTTTTLFWVGSLLGNIVFGWMSDKWGRRPTILLIITLEVPLTMITSFVPDYESYTVLRTMCGLFFPALFQIPMILALEILPPNKRNLAGLVISAIFASALCLLAILGNALRNWFHLSLAISVPFVLLFSYYWIIPESPRWLVSKGKIKEAEQVLIDMATKNGIVLKQGFLHKLHKAGKFINDLTETAEDATLFDERRSIPETNTKLTELVFDENERKYEQEPYNKKNFLMSENLKKIDEDKSETNSIDEGIHIEMREAKNSQVIDTSQDLNGIQHLSDVQSEIMQTSDTESHLNDVGSLQKATQTDPYTYKNNRGFRKSSLNFITKFISKESKENEESSERLDEECSEVEDEATPMDIIRNPNIRKKFLILTFDWLSNGIVYNGLSYNASNLGVSEYLAFFIGGIVELPAFVIVWWLMDHYGRKWVLCGAMAISGIACLCCMFVSEDQVWFTVALAMTGKFGIAGAFAVFYVFAGELIPTVLRSQVMGLSSFIAGVGLLTFPYIVHLAIYSKALPLILMGVLSLTASVVSVFLPETLHTPLPQTVKDGELFGKDYKVFNCTKKIKRDSSIT